MVPKSGHPFLWLWGLASKDCSSILCFDFSSPGPVDAMGLISAILVIKGNWNHILAPSLTFEIRDDIFPLNDSEYSPWWRISPASLIWALCSPDVVFLPCLSSASVLAPGLPLCLYEDFPVVSCSPADLPSSLPLTFIVGLLCATTGPHSGPTDQCWPETK